MGDLTFKEPDVNKYPSLTMGYAAGRFLRNHDWRLLRRQRAASYVSRKENRLLTFTKLST